MQLSLSSDALKAYVLALLAAHIPDGHYPSSLTDNLFSRALGRVEHSFSKIQRKYYNHPGGFCFDHLNADHMAALLYFLANTVWRESGDSALPVRLSYLNKMLHGLDLFYSVRMPDIFLLVHPLGTVLGNAEYSDYLVVYQGCTVGAVTSVYPKFGCGTILYSRVSVLGGCEVGDNVVFAANAQIVDVHVPADTLVLGHYPKQRFVPNMTSVRERCFDPIVS